MTKSTKTTGTKTTKITPKERVANRVKKIAAKHQAIREAGKPKTGPRILPTCPACGSFDVVVTTHGQSCSKCGHNEPNDAKVSLEQKVANGKRSCRYNTFKGKMLRNGLQSSCP